MSTTLNIDPVSGGITLYLNEGAPAISSVGKQTIWVPANSMVARTSSGAAAGSLEMTTNKNMLKSMDFDAAAGER